MLNAEFYKEKILQKFNNNNCTAMKAICKDFLGYNEKDYLSTPDLILEKEIFKWLLSEYKEPEIHLSPIEYNLLIYFKKQELYYLVRDKSDFLYVYQKPPVKGAFHWVNSNDKKAFIVGLLFNNLFQFITWEDEEPMNIQNILNNCKIEDENNSTL